jgi:hypothetical protein
LEKTIEGYQTDCYIVKEFTPIFFHSDDAMGDIKIDIINDTIGETDEEISIVEEKEDACELSMEKEEASEVTQLLLSAVLHPTLPSK